MTTKTQTRTSKLDKLNAALVIAKAALATAQAGLQPRIEAEQAKLRALRIAQEQASKVSSKAYDDYQKVLRSAEARLFPAGAVKKLLEAIKAKVGEQYPHADFARLAHEYQGRVVAADAEVVTARADHHTAQQAEEKARRAYRTADSFDSELRRLTDKLHAFKQRVSDLEKEIERVPTRNASARDRRAAEKQEELREEQTQAARALLADFSLENS